MKLSEIREIAANQKQKVETFEVGLLRESLSSLPELETHALIISGIRRCGKSTLLHQFTKKLQKDYFYFNFDDLRLYGFSFEDFVLLDTVIAESTCTLLFFDEIQSAPNWELYIRQKLDQQFQIIITGSNASLLSSELGTKLTGRHISKELFPFSYHEYCHFKNMPFCLVTLDRYLTDGGFPEFLKTGNIDILIQLQMDILYRNIAVRYGIRDVESLKRLFTFLLSNAAHLVSPSKLIQIVGVKSPSTILEYFSYFESAYLIQLVSRFSWSPKAQSLSPKKLYIVDSGLIRTGSVSFTKDMGSLLENFVFLELRRLTKDILYFSEKDCECDFIVDSHSNTSICIQVCRTLTADNQSREIKGLLVALAFFNVTEGFIITADTKDTILQDGKKITVVPAYEFDFTKIGKGHFLGALL